MIVQAIKSFAGTISMHAGEVRDIPAGDTLADLLQAGYVVEVVREEKKKTTKKGVK